MRGSCRLGRLLYSRPSSPRRPRMPAFEMTLQSRRTLLGAFLWAACLTSNLSAAPTIANRAQIKRSVTELQDSYDYVVVGGGTSGLVVANRLSEDSSSTPSPITLLWDQDLPQFRINTSG